MIATSATYSKGDRNSSSIPSTPTRKHGKSKGRTEEAVKPFHSPAKKSVSSRVPVYIDNFGELIKSLHADRIDNSAWLQESLRMEARISSIDKHVDSLGKTLRALDRMLDKVEPDLHALSAMMNDNTVDLLVRPASNADESPQQEKKEAEEET